LDVEDAIARFKVRLKKSVVSRSESMAAKARTRDSMQAVAKLTKVVDGQREIVSDPPLIVPVEELAADASYDMLRSLVTPAPVTASRSPPTSAVPASSSKPWPTSGWATRTRPNVITPRSPTPPRPAG
jgi:hypothetical protein